MQIHGETRVDYFHVLCSTCGTHVEITEIRWAGGVPEMLFACPRCQTRDSLKLMPAKWYNAIPLGKDFPSE